MTFMEHFFILSKPYKHIFLSVLSVSSNIKGLSYVFCQFCCQLLHVSSVHKGLWEADKLTRAWRDKPLLLLETCKNCIETDNNFVKLTKKLTTVFSVHQGLSSKLTKLTNYVKKG